MNNTSGTLTNREYFQMMNLAEMLEYKSNCECCQRMIQDHTILELYVCLQELSKRDRKHTEEVLRTL